MKRELLSKNIGKFLFIAYEMVALKKFMEQHEAIYHHTSSHLGYVPVDRCGEVYEYEGRYGLGYAVFHPCYETTRKCLVTYYIIPEEE